MNNDSVWDSLLLCCETIFFYKIIPMNNKYKISIVKIELFFSSQHSIREVGALNTKSDLEYSCIIICTHGLIYKQYEHIKLRNKVIEQRKLHNLSACELIQNNLKRRYQTELAIYMTCSNLLRRT